MINKINIIRIHDYIKIIYIKNIYQNLYNILNTIKIKTQISLNSTNILLVLLLQHNLSKSK